MFNMLYLSIYLFMQDPTDWMKLDLIGSVFPRHLASLSSLSTWKKMGIIMD